MNKSTVALFVVFVSKRLLICCEEFGFTGNSNCNLHLFYLESGTVDCAYVGKITSAHWLNKQVQPFCCVPEYLNWMAPQSEAVLFPTDSKKQALFYISGTSWSGEPHQHSANANSKFDGDLPFTLQDVLWEKLWFWPENWKRIQNGKLTSSRDLKVHDTIPCRF